MRLIEVDALKEKLDKIPARSIGNADGRAYVLIRLSTVLEIIKQMPSVQPERKRGKWIYNSPVTMKCNQCGLVIKDWDWHRFKYCPNCCAKMEVKND